MPEYGFPLTCILVQKDRIADSEKNGILTYSTHCENENFQTRLKFMHNLILFQTCQRISCTVGAYLLLNAFKNISSGI